MTELLIQFLIFAVLAAVFLGVLALVCSFLAKFIPEFSNFTPIIIKIAYIIIGLTAFFMFIIPLLRNLAAMAGLS